MTRPVTYKPGKGAFKEWSSRFGIGEDLIDVPLHLSNLHRMRVAREEREWQVEGEVEGRVDHAAIRKRCLRLEAARGRRDQALADKAEREQREARARQVDREQQATEDRACRNLTAAGPYSEHIRKLKELLVHIENVKRDLAAYRGRVLLEKMR